MLWVDNNDEHVFDFLYSTTFSQIRKKWNKLENVENGHLNSHWSKVELYQFDTLYLSQIDDELNC